jgi:hypothetical protein
VIGDATRTFLYISDLRYVWQYTFSNNLVTVLAQSTSMPPGFSGDNGPASSAQLSTPMGMWLTTAGDLYIADSGNHRIRKISGTIITTVVGSGCINGCTGGFSGDYGPATSALLNNPVAVYIDTTGRLYLSDNRNNCIRVVTATTKIITTFAGTGTASPFNGENLPATSANINSPADVKGDPSGNIYFGDSVNCLIRMVDTSGFIATLFGTPGSCGFTSGLSSRTSSIFHPEGIWIDTSSLSIYFTDWISVHRSEMVTSPTSQPSDQPTSKPSRQPAAQPSMQPSSQPTSQPTRNPSSQPSCQPTSKSTFKTFQLNLD